jgi:poly [ADP-ribose] polymerase
MGAASPRGILLLCEVALGDPKCYLNAQTDLLKSPPGFQSVHGVGRVTPDQATWTQLGPVAVPTGKLAERATDDPIIPGVKNYPLYHDEHIIYDIKQQMPRFLIEVEFQRR